MSATNTQFSVATHVMAALAHNHGQGQTSAQLTASVNADATFVRRVVSKLVKSGLVRTSRGQKGHAELSRPPAEITLLDIYQATQPPELCAVHGYDVQQRCPVSRNIKQSLGRVLDSGRTAFELALAGKRLSELMTEIHAAA
jgi:Rrf2 family protein